MCTGGSVFSSVVNEPKCAEIGSGTAMPDLAPGLHGKYSLYIDGNDFFTVPNLSVSRETHPRVTFGCWVRPLSSPGEILGQREGGTTRRALHIGLDNVPFLSLDGSGNRSLEMPKRLEMGHWYMVAALFNAVSGNMALYVDGDMVQSNIDASLLTSIIEDDNNCGGIRWFRRPTG